MLKQQDLGFFILHGFSGTPQANDDSFLSALLFLPFTTLHTLVLSFVISLVFADSDASN